MDDTQPPAAPPAPQSGPSPRQRLQALLAVPERERTDAQWDEINELEIMLAPGNREGAPNPGLQHQGGRRNGPSPMGHSHSNNPNGGGGGGGKNKRSGKKFHKRPSRGNPS
jgi:hypothetical protein